MSPWGRTFRILQTFRVARNREKETTPISGEKTPFFGAKKTPKLVGKQSGNGETFTAKSGIRPRSGGNDRWSVYECGVPRDR
jgi:hypothetical protein